MKRSIFSILEPLTNKLTTLIQVITALENHLAESGSLNIAQQKLILENARMMAEMLQEITVIASEDMKRGGK